MAYTLKKEHLTNWDVPKGYDKYPDYFEYDSPIPERSSLTLSPEPEPEPTPIPEPVVVKEIPKQEPKKKRNTLRYAYNELPKNGIPLATQYQIEKQEEKKRQKNIRKAPPGQGKLAPVPETKSEYKIPNNFYPHQRYIKETNPDLTQSYRQTEEGFLIPGRPVDPTKYLPEGALSVSSIKPTVRSKKAKKRPVKRNIIYNEQTKQYEYIQEPDAESKEDSDHPNNENRLVRIAADRLENRLDNRYRYRTEGPDGLPPVYPDDRYQGRRHHHHRHRHHHHHHHHRHRHHLSLAQPKHRVIESEPYVPNLEYVDDEFDVTDHSSKEKFHSPFFQLPQNHYRSTGPAPVYYQAPQLPLISQEQGQSSSRERLTNQSVSNFKRDWINSIDQAKTHKSDARTQFYDRYLNSVIDEQLTPI